MKTPEEIAAQLWCKPKHEKKVFDPDLARDIAQAIQAERDRAQILVDAIEKEIKRCGTWKEGKEALAEYSKAIIKPSEN